MNEKYDKVDADIPLPPAVHLLSNAFNAEGYELLVAGGAVRDYLYSKLHGDGRYSPKDIDLATVALPKGIIEILRKVPGVKVFPKGEAFGVISAVVEGEEYEIATFRQEWYDPESGDGRRPDKVWFGTPGADAARRDLTINALFYDIDSKEIRDYNDGWGLHDIEHKVVRPVGNARDRFREDKLRILRLVRFFSRFNPGNVVDHLEPDVLAAVDEFKNLRGISGERIANEFLAGLAKCLDPVNYLKNYVALGLLPSVFPGLDVDIGGIGRIGNIRNPKAILAWLMRFNGLPRDVKVRLNALKYSSDLFDRVEYLLQLHAFDVQKVVLYLQKRDIWKQTDDLDRKEEMEQDILAFARLAGMEKELNHFVSYQPVVRSQDFMHLKGAAIGKAMADAEREAYEWAKAESAPE